MHDGHFFLLSLGAIAKGSFSFNFKLTPFKLKSSRLSVDVEVTWSLGDEKAEGFEFALILLLIGGGLESITVFSLFFMLLTPNTPSSMLLEFWSRGFIRFFFSSSSSLTGA